MSLRVGDEWDHTDSRGLHTRTSALEGSAATLRSGRRLGSALGASSPSRAKLTQEQASEIFAERARQVLNEHYGVARVTPVSRYSPTSTTSYATPSSTSSSSYRSTATPPRPIPSSRPSVHSYATRSHTAQPLPPSPDAADLRSSPGVTVRRTDDSSSDESSTEDYSSVRPRRIGSIGAVHAYRSVTPPQRPPSASRSTLPSASLQEGVGLENLGNTCYMNAVLQCLVASPGLVEHLDEHAPHRERSSHQQGMCIADAFTELMQAMHASLAGQVISPGRFVEQAGLCNERWGNGQQSDAQEFLRSLLDMLHCELNRCARLMRFKSLSGKGSESQQAEEAWQQARTAQSSVVSDVFEGQLQSTLSCGTCGARSHNFEVFQDLSLPLPQDASPAGVPSIQDCLQAFTEVEELSGDDSHVCERCRSKQPTTKALRICRCPPVLVLHLKRFSMHASPLYISPFEKDSTQVCIAETLDVSPYCTPAASKAYPRPVYDLFGLVCHSGTLAGGHYTALTRKSSSEAWINHNDSFTSGEKPALKESRSAYLLFYSLRTS